MSKDIDVIHVAGPRSKDVVDALEPAAADVGFLKSKTIDNFAGLGFSVNLFRVSFTGCVGYELHAGTMRAVQFHLNGDQFDFVWLSTRTPPPMGVHRTCGAPNEIKKSAHPKNITALFRDASRQR